MELEGELYKISLKKKCLLESWLYSTCHGHFLGPASRADDTRLQRVQNSIVPAEQGRIQEKYWAGGLWYIRRGGGVWLPPPPPRLQKC